MNLRELYFQSDYKDQKGMLFNMNCMDLMGLFNSERERERESKSNHYRYSL